MKSYNMTVSAIQKKESRAIGTNPAIIDELKALTEQNNGLLKAEQVVEAARDENSSLHSRFEWDDTEAAEKFRLIQARMIISVSVEYVARGPKMVPQKVFVSLSTDRHTSGHRSSGYRTMVDVMADDDLRGQLLLDSLEQMTYFQEKYKSIEALGGVLKEMSKAAETIKRRLK